MDDDLRGALYNRAGMNFFVCEIDGDWHGGWFRIEGRTLEVRSETQRRTATIVDPDSQTELLRKLLTEIVHESASPPRPTESRDGQGLVSATFYGSSIFIFPADSAKAGERVDPEDGESAGDPRGNNRSDR